MFDAVPSSLPHIRSGALRALAVTTPRAQMCFPMCRRSPTLSPDMRRAPWIGATTRRGAPREIVETLNREINAGLANPGIKARLADLGMTPVPATTAEFGSFLAAETEKWGKVIKFAGIKAE